MNDVSAQGDSPQSQPGGVKPRRKLPWVISVFVLIAVAVVAIYLVVQHQHHARQESEALAEAQESLVTQEEQTHDVLSVNEKMSAQFADIYGDGEYSSIPPLRNQLERAESLLGSDETDKIGAVTGVADSVDTATQELQDTMSASATSGVADVLEEAEELFDLIDEYPVFADISEEEDALKKAMDRASEFSGDPGVRWPELTESMEAASNVVTTRQALKERMSDDLVEQHKEMEDRLNKTDGISEAAINEWVQRAGIPFRSGLVIEDKISGTLASMEDAHSLIARAHS